MKRLPVTPQWIIHIGTMKTGTTALQKALLENRQALSRTGLLYPESGLNRAKHDHFVWSCRPPELLGPRGQREYNKKSLDELLKEAAREIEMARPRFCVLSAEDFSFFPPAHFKPLFNRLPDYRVVIYLRDQKALVESMYKQLVAFGGMTSSFSDFLSSALSNGRAGSCDLDYYDLLDRWAKVVGKERLLVRTYAGDVKKNIVKDFFAAIGFEPSEPISTTRENLSIEGPYLDFMLSINDYMPEKFRRRVARDLKRLQQALSAEMASGQAAERKTTLLSAEQAAQIEKSFGVRNRSVAKKFLGREELFAQA